jgi:glyoxylase-like metal-dependent hydrolase (beta-lactamase superfamily II)
MRLLLPGLLVLVAVVGAPATSLGDEDNSNARQGGPTYSAWIIESCRIRDVPAGAFMPDRAFIPGHPNDPKHNVVFFQLPVNVGVIKHGNRVTLYDTGMKQPDLIRLIGCDPWAPIRDQLAVLGIRPEQVDKIVLGHGHWDHAGQISEFPNATLYVQREEIRGIEWALNYPGDPHIRAVNTSPGGCERTPACGYPPETVAEIFSKITAGQAVLVNGQANIAPGLTAIPAFRAHTAGSQLLQVNTRRGQLLFGSDVYSSWEGVRDWEVANIQQTDTVQQFLAYEKCYKIAGLQNCVAAHEPYSYTSRYPLTANSWCGPNGTRGAELVLAPGESSVVERARSMFNQNDPRCFPQNA